MSQPTPLNFHKDYHPNTLYSCIAYIQYINLKTQNRLLNKNSLEFNSYYTYKLMYNELIGS